ncbi:MAG: hypothetical protein IPN90_10670 [Elusimicrobia bacterium]|nr:hypothetical protein [Elusimicrobiota bacterium]
MRKRNPQLFSEQGTSSRTSRLARLFHRHGRALSVQQTSDGRPGPTGKSRFTEPARWGVGVVALVAVGGFCLWFFSTSAGKGGSLGILSPLSENATRFTVTAGSFTQGTRLFNILRGASLSPKLSQSVVQTLSKHLDPRSLNEGDHYEVWHSTSGDFRSLSVVRKLERIVVETAPLPGPTPWPREKKLSH